MLTRRVARSLTSWLYDSLTSFGLGYLGLTDAIPRPPVPPTTSEAFEAQWRELIALYGADQADSPRDETHS